MSDERYNNTGRWRSNWQKIRDPQQKADALDRMIFTKPIYEEPVYVMINKVHYAYAQPDQTDDPQDPRQLWSTNKL